MLGKPLGRRIEMMANLSCGHYQEVPECCEVGNVTACDECTDEFGPTNSTIVYCFSVSPFIDELED